MKKNTRQKNIVEDIEKLKNIQLSDCRKDFLLTFEKTEGDIKAVLKLAEILKKFYGSAIPTQVFQTGLAVSIFRDKSTRTRFSFSSAANLLGLSPYAFNETESQVSHGETVRETSNMISFQSEAIGIRDDKFIGRGNKYMKEVAGALDEGYESKVLDHRPCIVNLQCDIDHPTQTMSDLLHMKRHFGGQLENLRGKKFAMTWAYSPSYGKPLSVPQGLIGLMSRFGMDVHLAYPPGYEPMDEIVTLAENNSEKSGGNFTVSNSMEEAFENADVVYPKSWAPFSVMKERSERFNAGEYEEIKEIERACLERNAGHREWECTREKMDLTKEGNALYMHCLPADISGLSCEKGEVSADVFEEYRLKTYYEASLKPYIIAAMIIASRFKDPGAVMDYLYQKSRRGKDKPSPRGRG